MARPAETGLSYKSSGVDIDAGDAVVSGMRSLVGGDSNNQVLGGLGHFGGFYRVGPTGAGATLVASIDGVGTKLKVAALAARHDGIGYDIVHHCLNDIVACGAEPLFFLDYYGTGRLDPDAALTVIGGIAEACRQAGIPLLGGETAEMPGLYAEGDYDLVGAIVGLVDADRIVTGTGVQSGDVLVGIPSDGFHTNGYSLVRAALRLNESDHARDRLDGPAPFDRSRSLAEVLLRPHRSYRDEVRRLVGAGIVRGMAHITGGGLPGNVSRVIPEGLVAEINVESWNVPTEFEYVAEVGNVDRSECYRAFNMGIGFVAIVSEEDVPTALEFVDDALVIGRVVAGDGDARVALVSAKAELH